MKVRDIVRPNENAEFQSDVQLRWYSESDPSSRAKNLSLVRTYMFTRPPAGERKSPIDLLYQARQALLLDTHENRFVVIATYGHGKSHLALAMANFFGKPSGSEEVGLLLQSVKGAFSGEPEAESYREFKEGRKRQLVVCLEGTRPGDLSGLFLAALQKALRNESETAKERLPFWTDEALKFVEHVETNEDESRRADAFLKPHGLDVASLKARLANHDAALYDVAHDLCVHLRHVRPAWGGQVSLAHAVEWAADQYCGFDGDKPFSGMLILFDEFSAFIRNYALRSTPGNPLQDMLDGVSNRKGKVVFMAFGQSDPNASVMSVFHESPNNHTRAAMLLELERLPQTFRFHLYTTMEAVLDSYLHQETDKFKATLDQTNAWPAMIDATDDSLVLFRRRYETELGWDSEKFQEVVTFGAFPLHPITTALLCNIELLESSTPRSVLGFVLKHVAALQDAPVVEQGIPCWVRAIHLVDWFEEQLADDEWKQYNEALRQRGGDVTNEELAILKAMLLHVLSRLPTQQLGFSKTLAQMTGLARSQVEATLDGLARATVIEHIPAMHKYSFWPLGGGARLLQEHINKRIAVGNMEWPQWKQANDQAADFGLPGTSISVAWGHPDDWAAPQFYLPREFASAERVRELVARVPGCAIWLVARIDDDVDWFEANAEGLLSGLGENPLPVALMCPSRPVPHLVDSLHRLMVLESLSPTEIVQFGGGIVQTVKTQTNATIRDETRVLVTTKKRFIVPKPYAAAMMAAPPGDRTDAIMQGLYRLAYSSAPPAFFTQYKARTGNLKTAVTHLCKLLAHNDVYSRTYEANAVAVGLVDNFLVTGKPTSWSLLSLDKRLQEPLNERTQRAWKLLNEAVPSTGAEMPIKPAILKLQSPPFAYDENTLSLLFCAWYGYYRHDLALSMNGALSTTDELLQELSSPKDFAGVLSNCNIRISRRDRAAAISEVFQIVERCKHLYNQPFTRPEARAALAKLTAFLDDHRNEDSSERAKSQETKEIIQDALNEADTYDVEMSAIRKEADGQTDVSTVVRLLKKALGTEPSARVVTEQPPIPTVREELHKKLVAAVDLLCKRNQLLESLMHYVQQRDQLKHARTLLRDYVDLQNRVDEAVQRLDAEKARHEARQQDAAVVASMRVMPTTGPLAQLRLTLQSLEKTECSSDEARALRARTKEAVEKSIQKLEAFIGELDERVRSVTSAQDVAKVHSAISEQKLFFDGTPESAAVQAAVRRCDDLRCFFGELGNLAVAAFRTHQEHAAVAEALHGIAAKHESILSDPQKAVIAKCERKLQDRVDVLAKEASSWLKQAHSRVRDKAGLARLAEDLSRAPDFLPDTEQSALQVLVRTVEAEIARDKAESEAKQADAAVMAALRMMPTTGTLAQLRSNVEHLCGLVCVTGEAKSLLEARRKAIEAEIGRLCAFASGLQDKIDAVTGEAGLAKVQSAIIEQRLLFDGTPEAPAVKSAMDRCRSIGGFLKELGALDARPIRTRKDYADAEQALRDIRERHARDLSEAQLAAVASEEKRAKTSAAALEKDAGAWLDSIQSRSQRKKGVDLERLLDELSRPPEFLPPARAADLNALVEAVTKSLTEDTCRRICDLFQRITDKALQKRVLDELRKLASDEKAK